MGEDRCPHCKQPLPPKGLPEGVQLTTQQRRIWDCVLSWPGMSTSEVMDWVYGRNGSKGPSDDKIISVYIHAINKKLKPHGIEIRGHISHGYRLLKREVQTDALVTDKG